MVARLPGLLVYRHLHTRSLVEMCRQLRSANVDFSRLSCAPMKAPRRSRQQRPRGSIPFACALLPSDRAINEGGCHQKNNPVNSKGRARRIGLRKGRYAGDYPGLDWPGCRCTGEWLQPYCMSASISLTPSSTILSRSAKVRQLAWYTGSSQS